MPKVYLSEADRLCNKKLKQLRGRLAAERITNDQVGEWLNCTGANVAKHFRNGSFSYRQILVIEDRLSRIEREE